MPFGAMPRLQTIPWRAASHCCAGCWGTRLATRVTSRPWLRSDIDSYARLRSLTTVQENWLRPAMLVVRARVILPEHSRMERLRRTGLTLWRRSTEEPATRGKAGCRQIGGARGYGSG